MRSALFLSTKACKERLMNTIIPKFARFTLVSLMLVMAAISFTSCSKPSMPVSISFRGAALDQSLVAQFRNNSNRYLTIVAQFENKTLNQVKNGYIELPPMQTKEFGWMEGWKFMSGEYITVTHEDYASQTVRVP